MKEVIQLLSIYITTGSLLFASPPQTVDPGFNYSWNQISDEQREENLSAHKFLQKASPTETGYEIVFRKYHYASIPYFIYVSHDLVEWNFLGTVSPWDTFLLNAELNVTLESFENKTVLIPPFRNPPTTRKNAVIKVSSSVQERGVFFAIVNSHEPYTPDDYSSDRTEDYIAPVAIK
ncbi:hypothetical protein SH580_01390 [Coraliomargarita algicola]|uniref:Uncharacterized protein n=1 Tax=Coraliomargarita algicola TaxID=3092156 RepID=A0ABZ0RM89_9BACT|nr:hypothetical protein [Coraliomargarita sp. J2-16]WPJ96354.1 hypothetical protein SH580_01390 [Coraliomargarita sp. J2-16]